MVVTKGDTAILDYSSYTIRKKSLACEHFLWPISSHCRAGVLPYNDWDLLHLQPH